MATLSEFVKAIGRVGRSFVADTRGSYVAIAGIALPALIGAAGLGSEAGYAYYRHASVQAAADAAAISAANAIMAGSSAVALEAKGVAGFLGYVDGTGGVTVTVNNPPASGSATGQSTSVEVIIRTTQRPLLMAALRGGTYTISGRAVARSGSKGGCILALNQTSSASISIQGTPAISLNGCALYDDSNNASALSLGGSASLSASAVYVVGGISGAALITASTVATSAAYASDPYGSTSVSSFAGCDYTKVTIKGAASLSPGVYCASVQLNTGDAVTLAPGTYIFDGGRGGSLTANGGSLSGTGVTLVFTSSTGSSYATASISGGASVNLTAPTTAGPYTGIVIYGDRNMPTGTAFKLAGGSSQIFGGTIYLPKASLNYAGGTGSTGCTQIIADTISFVGTSSLAIACSGYGTKSIGVTPTALIE